MVQAGPRWYERPGYVALSMLAALGLGAVSTGWILTLELGPGGRSRLAVIAAGVPALLALALVSVGRARLGPLAQRLNERATEEFNCLIALAAMFAIDVLAILLASGSRPWAAWLLLGVAAAWVVLWLPPALRRLTATTTMVFACDRAKVFAFLSDFRTVPKYMPNVEMVEKLTGGPIGIGSRFLTRIRSPHGVFEAVDRIVDYEQDMRYASSIESSRQSPLGVATFARVPEGTLATFRFSTTRSYASALLGSSLRRWGMAQRLSAQRREAWTRVKKILESAESEAPATT